MMRFSGLFALFLLAPVAAFANGASADRIVLPDTAAPVAYDLSIVPNAKARTFSGSVAISLVVRKPTADLVLNAADLAFAKVSLSGEKAAPAVHFDPGQETATLHFSHVLKPGNYVLKIAYAGKINKSAAGLFSLDYQVQGKTRSALYTQFENSDARRFVPCWDEPAHKAVFTLTATLPADQMALSNMPAVSEKKLAGGKKVVRFAASPKMSSYLLFYGQGDFERVSRKVAGVDIGVIVKRGDTAKAGYALDAAGQLLTYYNDYFGTPYPLPKMDLIAGVGNSQFFSAMENWGAIFFFERALLLDENHSTESDKRGVFITVAHEMAHQWFGDLVTMAWWDDLWLNEGFASWMEYKAADALHPEWNAGLSALTAKEYAMRVDAQNGTHPVIQHIADVLSASEAFDTITYQKGQATISMLEDYIGSDAFRNGVRAYMKAHAYGNTVTDELWQQIDKVSQTPLKDVAHSFTLQEGVPLLSVGVSAGGIRLTLSRFTRDGEDKPQLWQVPVAVAGADGKVLWRGHVGVSPVDVAVPEGAVVVVNPGQKGYYRTRYDDALMARLSENFSRLSPADQYGIINDAWALGEAGIRPMTDGFTLSRMVGPHSDVQLQTRVAEQMEILERQSRGLPVHQAVRNYALSVLRPMFAAIGWQKREGDSGNVLLLRSELILALDACDDPDVIAEARQRFDAMTGAGKVPLPEGYDRDALLSVVASHADVARWEILHKMARESTDTMQMQRAYLKLSQAKDPALAEKYLELALSDETPVNMRPAMVRAVSLVHPQIGFDFAMAHLQAFDGLLEPESRVQYFPGLLYTSDDPAYIAKVDAYVAAHASGRKLRVAEMIKANITHTDMVRRLRLPTAATWLAPYREPKK